MTIRTLTLLAVFVLPLGITCLGDDALGDDVAAKDIERDLKLEIVLPDGARHESGTPLLADLRIRNTSDARTYQAIAATGTMCQVPGTEPHVWFTAEIDTGNGVWREIERNERFGMCGFGDYGWHDRVRTIAPGGVLDIRQLNAISMFLDFQAAGTVRLVAHYAYAKHTDVRLPGAQEEAGPMKGVDPFELVSDPIEFEVVRPINVNTSVVGALETGSPTRVADLLDVKIENGRDVALDAPAGTWSLYVMWRTDEGVVRIKRELDRREPEPLHIGPNKSIVAIGKAGLLDETVTLEKRPKGALEVAVMLEMSHGVVRRLRSAWVEVPVK